MVLKVQKARNFTAGDRKIDSAEEIITDLKFKVHKFTVRHKPADKRNIVIFPLFAEFGCETLASIYCIPKLLQYFAGKYTIILGWYGREYLYRHLVDEFWEIPDEYMWLREYTRAFHHVSKNLKRIEKEASKFGQLVEASHLGNVAVFPKLDKCPHEKCRGQIADKDVQYCLSCQSVFPRPGLFSKVKDSKGEAKWLPDPSPAKMEKAKEYLPSNPVGISARRRKTWGRNLEPIFYERLIYLLEDMGYNPVWIGEKITSLPCPYKRIVDYSSSEDANDLETTLALVKQLRFTIQFWTASSRLAALVGTPYIIFESPDQIWGTGQEGMRLNLLTRGNKKLVICHYKNVYSNNTKALELVYNSVRDVENGNFDDIIGLVENKDHVRYLKSIHDQRIGGT